MQGARLWGLLPSLLLGEQVEPDDPEEDTL